MDSFLKNKKSVFLVTTIIISDNKNSWTRISVFLHEYLHEYLTDFIHEFSWIFIIPSKKEYSVISKIAYISYEN